MEQYELKPRSEGVTTPINKDLARKLAKHSRPKRKPAKATAKVGRNDPCHCGSDRKYKKCCLPKERRMESNVNKEVAPPMAMDQANSILRSYSQHCSTVHRSSSNAYKAVIEALQSVPQTDETEYVIRKLNNKLAEFIGSGRGVDARIAEALEAIVETLPELPAPPLKDGGNNPGLNQGDDKKDTEPPTEPPVKEPDGDTEPVADTTGKLNEPAGEQETIKLDEHRDTETGQGSDTTPAEDTEPVTETPQETEPADPPKEPVTEPPADPPEEKKTTPPAATGGSKKKSKKDRKGGK